MLNTVYQLKRPRQFEAVFKEIDLDQSQVLVRPTHLSICNADQRYYQGTRNKEALNQLESWIGCDYETSIYSWSNADFQQITKECEYKCIHIPDNMTKWVDFQSEYFKAMDLDSSCRQLSLHKAAEQFGIVMDDKKTHSALYDATVTAELLIPILNGDYKEQREYLKKSNTMELEDHSFTLGDACGNVLKQFLLQMQITEEPIMV